MILTRVPCVGESVLVEGKCYQIVFVQHEPVNEEGRAPLGIHASLDVIEITDPFDLRAKTKKKLGIKKRS